LIVKHIRRFHDGAAPILPATHMRTLMLRAHDNFKRALRTRLLEMDVTQHDATTYALVCSEFSYYMEGIVQIECCADLVDTMNDVMTIRI